MYVVKSNEEMASDFITGTCQLLSKSYSPSSNDMHDLVMSPDTLPKQYSIVCGSQAEFYIRPLNTCISDIDFMVSRNDELACNDKYPVLPSDRSGLEDTTQCYEIKSYYAFPGFVRLRFLGEMKYNWKHREYKLSHPVSPSIYIRIDRTVALNSYMDQFSRILIKNTLPRVTSGP